MPVKPIVRFFITLAFMLCVTLSACLKDDFSKRADSEWNPDFAFPLVNSELSINQLLIQKHSPAQIGLNDSNVVEVIYNSHNYSRRVSELISLPPFSQGLSIGMSSVGNSTFNSNTILGNQVVDSAIFQIPYSLDGLLGANSKLDTVFFSSGSFSVSILSHVAQDAIVRAELPGLFINGQPFMQNIELIHGEAAIVSGSFNRNLGGSYLVIPNSEALKLRFVITLTRTSAGDIPLNGLFSVSADLVSPKFKRISGYFAGLQMPIVTNDTLFLGLFQNVISATELQFVAPRATIRFQNSTGIPLTASVQSFEGFRPGAAIPPVNLTGLGFPLSISGQPTYFGAPASAEVNLTHLNGSNISNVINAFPRYMRTSTSTNFEYGNPGTWSFLFDTSRIGVYSEVKLPLDGLTLDLQLRDTVDFDFTEITRDVERALIRLNIANGFPCDATLQVYFCKRTRNAAGKTTSLQKLDSLYSAGAELPLVSGITNSTGTATEQSFKITDAIIDGDKWTKLRVRNANSLLIKVKLTTSNNGNSMVKVFEHHRMNIRIAAQLKIRKTF